MRTKREGSELASRVVDAVELIAFKKAVHVKVWLRSKVPCAQHV